MDVVKESYTVTSRIKSIWLKVHTRTQILSVIYAGEGQAVKYELCGSSKVAVI